MKITLVLLSLAGFAGLGTRTSLIMTIISPFAVLFVIIWVKKNTNNKRRRLKHKILISISLLILMFGTAIIIKRTIENIKKYQYQIKKLESIINLELPRLLLMKAGFDYIAERDMLFNLFGEGKTRYERGVSKHWIGNRNDRKSVEVDWLDIFGSYGIFFAIAIHLFYIHFIKKSLKFFLFKHSPTHGLVFLGVSAYFAHSVLAGHALVIILPKNWTEV